MNPTLAAVLGVAKAIESVFTFLCTEQGQRQVKVWIDNAERFRSDRLAIEAWVKTTWAGIFATIRGGEVKPPAK